MVSTLVPYSRQEQNYARSSTPVYVPVLEVGTPTIDTCTVALKDKPRPCTRLLHCLLGPSPPPVAISLSRPFFLFLRRRPHHLRRSLFLVVHQPIACCHRTSIPQRSRRRSGKSLSNSPHRIPLPSIIIPHRRHGALIERVSVSPTAAAGTSSILLFVCSVRVATIQPSPRPLHCLLSNPSCAIVATCMQVSLCA